MGRSSTSLLQKTPDSPVSARMMNSCERSPPMGDEHLVVGNSCRRFVDVERIGVLHQELAAAHHAKARTLLVAEFPLDVIENLRQFAIGVNIGAEDLGDHVLVGEPIKHVALMAILDAQHFRAVGVVASALAPKIGKLQGRHQELDGTGAVLLLAHDLFDLLEHAKAERQPCVDPGGLLADEACPQHQPVGGDLRLLRSLAQDRQKVAGEAHDGWESFPSGPPSETGSPPKKQGLSKPSDQLLGLVGAVAAEAVMTRRTR